MLTLRECKLATKLLDAEHIIKIQDLSEQFQVCTRTIKYDLEKVRAWFSAHACVLHAQPNKGIWLDTNGANKYKLRKQLQLAVHQPSYVQQSRVQHLFVELLLCAEWLTASNLANKLDVSRTTIQSDIAFIEKKAREHNLSLERRARYGFRIRGEERFIRQALEYEIYLALDQHMRSDMINALKQSKLESVDFHIPKENVLSKMEHRFQHALGTMPIQTRQQQTTDEELLTFAVRLVVMSARLDQGRTIGTYRAFQNEKDFFAKWFTSFCKVTGFAPLHDEWKHMQQSDEKVVYDDDLPFRVQQLIEQVSIEMNVPFVSDTTLYTHLLAHVSTSTNKGTFDYANLQPFTEEIRHQHARLFESIHKVTSDWQVVVDSRSHEALTTYVSLHFLVSLEKIQVFTPKIPTLYVCATGRGVARLVKDRIEKEVPNIGFIGYCSVGEMEQWLATNDVALVVSAFHVNCDVPVVVVEPLPTALDISNIQYTVEGILKEAPVRNHHVQEEHRQTYEQMDVSTRSQEVIMKGAELLFLFQQHYPYVERMAMRNAFVVHLFLMVHRLIFGGEYDSFTRAPKAKEEIELERIKRILTSVNLHANESELAALYYYLNNDVGGDT
ncbi:MAG: BglG family transcription antiterminator [Bacilli bacterium]